MVRPAVPGGRPDPVVIGVLSGDVAHPLYDVGFAYLVRDRRGLTAIEYTRHRVQRLCDRRAARGRQAERRNEQYGFDADCFHLDDRFRQGRQIYFARLNKIIIDLNNIANIYLYLLTISFNLNY